MFRRWKSVAQFAGPGWNERGCACWGGSWKVFSRGRRPAWKASNSGSNWRWFGVVDRKPLKVLVKSAQ